MAWMPGQPALGWYDTVVSSSFDPLFSNGIFIPSTYDNSYDTPFINAPLDTSIRVFPAPGVPVAINNKLVLSCEGAPSWTGTVMFSCDQFNTASASQAFYVAFMLSATAGMTVGSTNVIPITALSGLVVQAILIGPVQCVPTGTPVTYVAGSASAWCYLTIPSWVTPPPGATFWSVGIVNISASAGLAVSPSIYFAQTPLDQSRWSQSLLGSAQRTS
jgi:hypothetical protein